jgi:hypothetical protein
MNGNFTADQAQKEPREATAEQVAWIGCQLRDVERRLRFGSFYSGAAAEGIKNAAKNRPSGGYADAYSRNNGDNQSRA